MPESKIWTRFSIPRASRRRMLAGAGAVTGGAIVLVACGGGGKATKSALRPASLTANTTCRSGRHGPAVSETVP